MQYVSWMRVALKEIYLCRHGATEWSKSGRHTGNTDLLLLDEGKEQAAKLKPVLQKIDFAAVYSSPLKRARQTAELAGFKSYQLADALREWDYGEYEGLTTPEICKHVPNWNIFDYGAKGGEDCQQIKKRIQAFFEHLEQYNGKVLLFSSGHISRAIAAMWIGLSPKEGKVLKLSTGSLSILGYEHTWRAICLWNAS